MQKQNLIMRDFAKNKTVFSKELERMRELALKEAWKAITPRGWANRIFHALAGKKIIGNWN